MKKIISSAKKILFVSIPTAVILFASNAFAATTIQGTCSISGMNNLRDIIIRFVVGCILSRTIYLLIAVSFIVFIWGIFRFMTSEGDNKQGGRELMFWGIIGLFVMISIWGLVAILQNTFHLSGSYDITPRQVNISL